MRRSASAVLFLAAVLALCVAPPATAATYSSSGARCTIVGTPSADRLTGSGGRDVICGRGGDDVILARGGNDLVDGGRGQDTLVGGTGTDQLSGGPAGDVLTGGSGGDELDGNRGNDDLAGGSGGDRLDGGPGTDWCTVSAADEQLRCVYDREAPSAGQLRLEVDRVDVTSADAYVDVWVRVTDDTGATSVSVSAGDAMATGGTPTSWAALVSGTVRDGVWKTTLRVPRWSVPGDWNVAVGVRDRVRRYGGEDFRDQPLTVVDRNPDLALPEIELLAPEPDASYDVRSSGQAVVVRARITDDASGVAYADFCLDKPFNGQYSLLRCDRGTLVSGDRHDGVWRVELWIPKGQPGGDWNVSMTTTDRAHSGLSDVQWFGPDVYPLYDPEGLHEDPWFRLFPDGRGRFHVLGTQDSFAPVIESVGIEPREVDTLTRPATVTFNVRATDAAGEGVTGVGVSLSSAESSPADPDFGYVELELAAGDRTDGIWRGSLTLPQGTPPGTYYLQVWAEDLSHFRSYVTDGGPHADNPDQTLLPPATVVTVLDTEAP